MSKWVECLLPAAPTPVLRVAFSAKFRLLLLGPYETASQYAKFDSISVLQVTHLEQRDPFI